MSKTKLIVALCASAMCAGTAGAAWEPEKPVEFVVASNAGGGSDIFTRQIQSIIGKYKLMKSPIVVLNKGGGSGSDGFVYGSANANDPYRVTFGTNNEYLLPLVVKVGYSADSLLPVAALALDEFLLWVPNDSPYKDAKSFIEAAKTKPDGLRMGGSQAKDTDQTLVSMITEATGAKITYIPFKSGSEAAVQLAGGHIDANLNNPSENIGQWKAGMVRPLCVFSNKRMAAGPKVTKDMGWADIPLCKDEGIAIDVYQMPRTIWLPVGASKDAVDFYTGVFRKVSETPEWKEYIERSSQTGGFMGGEELKNYTTKDAERASGVFKREGWLVK